MSKTIRVDKEVKILIDARRSLMKANGLKKVSRSDALRSLLSEKFPEVFQGTDVTVSEMGPETVQ